jgi:hypothetical protein
MSGRSSYTCGAIDETEDGTAIRLGTPLTTKTTPAGRRPATVPRRGSSTGERRRAVGLLGLLHYLWEQSQLTLWHPSWHRSWHTCHARLAQQAADCTLNKHQLADILYVIPPYRQETAERAAEAFDAFTRRLGRHRTVHRRGLLLGEIKEALATQYGTRIALRHQRGPIFASAALMDRLKRSYRPAFSDAAAQLGASVRRIGLFLVDRSRAGYLFVEDAAVMLTNTAYIPADSTHEVAMAGALAAAGRSFSKPVRYDVADDVFPDFILTDTPHGPVYVEVYGMTGSAAYTERKRIKQAWYQQRGLPVIEWDTTEPMPPLDLRPQ